MNKGSMKSGRYYKVVDNVHGAAIIKVDKKKGDDPSRIIGATISEMNSNRTPKEWEFTERLDGLFLPGRAISEASDEEALWLEACIEAKRMVGKPEPKEYAIY